MAKQVLAAFFVFLFFVMAGVIIFLATRDVGTWLPFEDPRTLAEQMSTWEETRDEKGRFTVKTPTYTQYSIDHVKVPGQEDTVIPHEIYTATGFNSERYFIGVVQLPDDFDTSDAKSILTAEMDSLLETYGYTVLRDYQTVDFNGYPGIQFKLKQEKRTIACFFFLAGQTLYELYMDAQGIDLPEENFQYFIESFRLTPSEVNHE